MSALNVDFGPPRRSVMRYVGWILLLIAAGLVGYEAWCYGRYTQTRHILESDRNHLKELATVPARSALSGVSAPSKEELRRAVQAVDQLNIPWGRLFEGVEASMDDQVALLAMEPDVERQEIRLRVEAKDMESMFGYLKRIDNAAGLSDAYLESHQLVLQDPQRPVRFTVVARWAMRPSSIDAVAPRDMPP